MADAAIDTKETTPAVEKETVSSPVKECPIKETNGSSKKTEDTTENGTEEKNGTNGKSKENGSSKDVEETNDDEDVKENGDSDACPIKRKSCSGDAEAPEATTPEKKAKLAVEDSAETVEA